VDPRYFLDEMTMNEASYIIKNKEDDFVNHWNQTRYICYSIIQSQSTSKLKPSDVIKFPWEDNEEKETRIPDNNSKERLRNMALELEKQFNNNVR